jgi:multicomponent Na+:H+ antiporter subunit B
MIEIHLILIFMITAAIIAVEVKDLVSSVIAVGAVGMGLCMAFLVLKAPDLAMMQLVVEILSLIILIRATIRKDLPFSASGRWLFNTVCTVLFLLVFLVLAFISLKNIPQFGQPIMKVSKVYLEEGLAKTGAMNIISAITLNFRALDTLGEATILFTAIIGVLAIARKVAHDKDRR